ncbi:type III secretion protein [Pseudomonas sp. D1-1]|uniref:type III secretion protein n=1 Tax=Pseudomonas sp. D1-1 TaxID=1040793 RepID=UPI003DAA3B86
MDEDLDMDPERQALERVIGLLGPLRQHRQASAERARGRLARELAKLREQLLASESSMDQERTNQKRKRRALADTHLQTTLELADIDRWHEKERRMLDRLAQIRQDVSQLRLHIETQEQSLQQAQLDVKARQRAVEKLACMSETLSEE